MMKTLLILPPNIGRYIVATVPHAGLAFLAAILESKGHSVDVHDMRLYPSNEYLFNKINLFKPELVGISTASIGYKMAYSIVDAIKTHYPKLPVVIGGSYASTVHTKVLQDTRADFAVYGEGEHAFLDIASGIEPRDVRGLIWRDGEEITMNPPPKFFNDLDNLPYPNYDKFELDKMLEKRIPIVSSRGCPNRCTFCSIQLVMGYPFRTRSPENVVNELKYWYNRGYDTFEFSDDNFTFNMPRAEKICDLIVESGMKLKLIFGNGLRADRVNEQLLTKLKQAGTVWIGYGLETSDELGLQLLKKDLHVDQLRSAVEHTKRLGIECQIHFIIGNPGETYDTFKKDLKFAEESSPDQVRFFNMIPYPGTEMFEWVKQNGTFLHQPEEYLNSFDYWGEEPVFETEEFPREQRIKAFKEGQYKIMEVFLKRRFGRRLGAFGYNVFYRNKYFHNLGGMKLATWMWITLKRARVFQY